jgi:hypothetical protein
VPQQERCVPGAGQCRHSTGNLVEEAGDRMIRANNRTLIKAAHLPQESVGWRGDPLCPLLPRLPCPRLVEVGGFASADARVPMSR